jgi:hypothetical protein
MRPNNPTEPESVDKIIEEVENQIRHLERSSAELQALLDAGVDDEGLALGADDRTVYAEAITENARAIATRRAHLAELRGVYL